MTFIVNKMNKNNELSRQASAQDARDEISLIDILHFLKGAWKAIAIFGLAGVAFSIAYLAITPKQYEAVAQIAMAQIDSANINNLNPLGVNIEEPSMLMARLSQPTSFPVQVMSSCGLEVDKVGALALSKTIKLSIPKGVANIVELKTFGKSTEEVVACAQAIFELIKVTQAQIVAPYVEEAKAKLTDDEERLKKAKEVVAKADKLDSAMGAAYLSTRDEIRFLLDEITALKNVVISNQSRSTRLIAPIYASDIPVAPKKRMVLVVGLFGGLFLGLLLALGRQMWLRFKDELQDQNQGAM